MELMSRDSGMKVKKKKRIHHENIIYVAYWTLTYNHGKTGRQDCHSSVIILGGREGKSHFYIWIECRNIICIFP